MQFIMKLIGCMGSGKGRLQSPTIFGCHLLNATGVSVNINHCKSLQIHLMPVWYPNHQFLLPRHTCIRPSAISAMHGEIACSTGLDYPVVRRGWFGDPGVCAVPPVIALFPPISVLPISRGVVVAGSGMIYIRNIRHK